MCNTKRPKRKPEETFSLLMETTSQSKVTIPLVAAIPFPVNCNYATIPISLFTGKVDTSAKTNIKSNRVQPYQIVARQRSVERKSCSNCNNQAHNQTTSGEQTAKNIKVSNMYNGSGPMLLLPFVSAKPNQQIQQKALPTNLYSQHPLSMYHAKKTEDLSSRVI